MLRCRTFLLVSYEAYHPFHSPDRDTGKEEEKTPGRGKRGAWQTLHGLAFLTTIRDDGVTLSFVSGFRWPWPGEEVRVAPFCQGLEFRT